MDRCYIAIEGDGDYRHKMVKSLMDGVRPDGYSINTAKGVTVMEICGDEDIGCDIKTGGAL